MRKIHRAATVAVAIVGVVVTAVVASVLQDRAQHDHIVRVQQAAEMLRSSLIQEVESLTSSAEGLRNGLTADPASPLAWPVDGSQVSQAISRGFAQRSLSPARMGSLFRAVPLTDVTAYQSMLRATRSEFTVHPSPTRTAYIVEVLHPLAGNERALGFDIGSEERRRTAIERARDTGSVATTEPLQLVQDADGPASVILIVPAYADFDVPDTAPARKEQFVGGISLIVAPEALLDAARGTARDLDVAVVDVGRIGLAGTAARTEEGVALVGQPPANPTVEVDVHVGDRRWRLLVTPTGEFGGPNTLPVVLWIVAMGLLTAMSTALAHMLRTREARASDLAEQRTQQLRESEERLRTINGHLAESDALKTSFLVTVSHELRTPLTTIRGFADLLQRPDADLTVEERAGFLRQLSRSAEGLSSLLGDVLEFAELEQMGPLVSSMPFGVSDLLDDVLDPYRETNQIVVTARQVDALGDPQQLRRVLQAVLNNARTYAPDDSTIGLWVRPADHQVEIVIDDEGPGVPDADLERVFQRFYRGAHAADGNVPGTGIGLTVARQLMEAMGGRIHLEPAPGGGTRVVIGLVDAHPDPAAADSLAEAIL